MNPIWRVTMEMSKSRSENQKLSKKRQEMMKDKTRKEKEKRRAEALERDRQRYIVGQEQDPEDGDRDDPIEDVQESAAEKFQKELCWCIQQTQLELANLKPASNEAKSQAEEGQKLLRVLTSSKAPMAKKRQVMRATFGDYRSKMQQEERKHKADMSKKMCLEPVSPSKQASSTFYRKSTTTTPAAPPDDDPKGTACQGSSGAGPSPDERSPGSERLQSGQTDESVEALERGTKDMHITGRPPSETGRETVSGDRGSVKSQAEEEAKSGGTSRAKPAGSVAPRDEPAEWSGPKPDTAPDATPDAAPDRPFAFNFDIRERDLDSRSRGSNRAADSSPSENSTPEKGPSGGGGGRRKTNSRRRSRAKKKQLSLIKDKEAAVVAGNQDAVVAGNQDAVVVSNQDAVVGGGNQDAVGGGGNQPATDADSRATILDNQKLQQEADREFRFNFPDPAEQAVVP